MLIPCSLAGGKYAYVKFEIPQRYLSRFEDVYRQYYCTHGCFDGRKGKGVRVQTAYRFTGCSASITCIVARAANGSLFIKTKNEVSTSIYSVVLTLVEMLVRITLLTMVLAMVLLLYRYPNTTTTSLKTFTMFFVVVRLWMQDNLGLLSIYFVALKCLCAILLSFFPLKLVRSNLREIVQNGNAKLHSPFLVCLDCDLSNQDVRNYCTARYGGPDTEQKLLRFIDDYMAIPGNRAFILREYDDVVSGVVLVNKSQREAYRRWGEALILDWTYNVNNVGFQLGEAFGMYTKSEYAC